MSDYVKITDYAAKDSLLSGDPNKLVKGSEIGADFDAVAVAVATKADEDSAVMTNVDINSGTIDGTVIGGSSAAAATVTSLSDSGNLTFTGTGNRISGDFSNATVASRVMFQSSTVNGNTLVEAIPNGTGATGSFRANNTSDPTNGSVAILTSNASEMALQASRYGTGTYLPMTFYTNGSKRFDISTAGLCTAYNGLTVSGAAFTSRGITDNATATALTIDSSGNATNKGYLQSGITGTDGAVKLARSSDGLGVVTISLNSATQVLDYNNALGSGIHTFSVNSVERMRIASDSTTTLGGTSTAPAFKVVPVASQTSWPVAVASVSGFPYITVDGAATDISVLLSSKNAGAVFLQTALTTQVQIAHTASANRYITLTGSNGGNPTIGTSAGSLNFSTSICTPLVTNTAATLTVAETTDTIIQTTAASVYTLPTASSYTGRKLRIVTQFAGTVTSASSNVVPLAGGAAGTAILAATAGKWADLQSNGTNWVITAAN